MPPLTPRNGRRDDATDSGNTQQTLGTNVDVSKSNQRLKQPSKTVRFAERAIAITYDHPIPMDPYEATNSPSKDVDLRAEGERSKQPSETHGDTEENRLISDLYAQHEIVRNQLRSTPFIDYQSAIQYGIRLKGRRDPKTKLPRWKYLYNGMVYITDNTSSQSITCHKDAVQIPRVATDNVPSIQKRHDMDVRILHHDDPQLCMTHIIIIMDQSGSMRLSTSSSCSNKNDSHNITSCGSGFKTRSQAAYGVLVLDYIAQQLHEQHQQQYRQRRRRFHTRRRSGTGVGKCDADDDGSSIIDAVTVIEMKDNDAAIVFFKQPLDWIFYNKLVQHQKEESQQPKGHGNCAKALRLASSLIHSELPHVPKMSRHHDQLQDAVLERGYQKEDISSYVIVFISDGNPTDWNIDAQLERTYIIRDLCSLLRSSLSFLAIGLDDNCSSSSPTLIGKTKFDAMISMVDAVQSHNSGSYGTFTLANIGSGVSLSDAFSAISARTSAIRNEQMMIKKDESNRRNENRGAASSDQPGYGSSTGNHNAQSTRDTDSPSGHHQHRNRHRYRSNGSNCKTQGLCVRPKDTPLSRRRFIKHTENVSRWRYDTVRLIRTHGDTNGNCNCLPPWVKVGFQNKDAVAIDIETEPFGIGAERAAYIMHELDSSDQRLGSAMVAKESIHSTKANSNKHQCESPDMMIPSIADEQVPQLRPLQDQEREVQRRIFQEFKVHEMSCLAQHTANQLALRFNKAIEQAEQLRPVDMGMKVPHITFLTCSVYDYVSPADGQRKALLVENFLPGKFTKYNGNQGYVKRIAKESYLCREIELQVGTVLWTDFLQAFSHFVYCTTNHAMLVCDLQGVLDQEGIRPKFVLTDPCICSKRVAGKGHNPQRSGTAHYGTEDRTTTKRYGRTDLGMKGIRLFRSTHICNDVCKGLGLPEFGIRPPPENG